MGAVRHCWRKTRGCLFIPSSIMYGEIL